MSEEENSNQSETDILGIRPAAMALDRLTKASIDGASAILSRLCLPAAEEFGLLLKDRASYWRALNAAKIAEKTALLLGNSPVAKQGNPRVVWEAINKGSWSDNTLIQSMWAGLIASNCLSKNSTDSDVVFISILEKLSSLQAKILNEGTERYWNQALRRGELDAGNVFCQREEIHEFTGVADTDRIERELRILADMKLVGTSLTVAQMTGFRDPFFSITPTPLGIDLYIRCKGFNGSRYDYWQSLKVDED